MSDEIPAARVEEDLLSLLDDVYKSLRGLDGKCHTVASGIFTFAYNKPEIVEPAIKEAESAYRDAQVQYGRLKTRPYVDSILAQKVEDAIGSFRKGLDNASFIMGSKSIEEVTPSDVIDSFKDGFTQIEGYGEKMKSTLGELTTS
jgi:hypothetical protein